MIVGEKGSQKRGPWASFWMFVGCCSRAFCVVWSLIYGIENKLYTTFMLFPPRANFIPSSPCINFKGLRIQWACFGLGWRIIGERAVVRGKGFHRGHRFGISNPVWESDALSHDDGGKGGWVMGGKESVFMWRSIRRELKCVARISMPKWLNPKWKLHPSTDRHEVFFVFGSGRTRLAQRLVPPLRSSFIQWQFFTGID